MADKKDDAGKRPTDDAQGKRPFATIDLKATEVEMKGGRTTADAKAGPASAAAMMAASAQAGAARAADAAKTSTTAASGSAGASAASAHAPSGATSPNLTLDHQRGSGGGGGFFSHLAAGIAGAALTLFGATTLLPNLTPSGGNPAATAELQRRMAALEQTSARPTTALSAEAAQKLTQLDARTAKIEQLEKAIAGLSDAQNQVAALAKDIQAKPAQLDDATAQRIAKLEETLKSLADAARAEPQSAGRIPQLAALTGRIADLEGNLTNRSNALRADIFAEVDKRIASVSEQSETAKTGTQRIDRDLSSLKNDTVRLGQRLDGLKETTDRIEATVRTADEQSTGMRAKLTGLETELGARTKPADVASAIAPVAAKVTSLEQNLASVVKGEQDRNATAERIVLSLELANLKRALDRGHPFGSELAAVKKAGGGKFDLTALEKAQGGGIASLGDLGNEFRRIAYQIIDADVEPADSGVVDRLLSGARSVVRVRKVSHSADDKSAEAVVARMEKALGEGRLADVMEQAKGLSGKAAKPAEAWLKKVAARAEIDRAIGTIEGQLKSTLGGSAAASAAAPAATPAAAPGQGTK
jgi:hypothetical protein